MLQHRASRFDEVHVVVIDGDGKVTGNLEQFLRRHLTSIESKRCRVFSLDLLLIGELTEN